MKEQTVTVRTEYYDGNITLVRAVLGDISVIGAARRDSSDPKNKQIGIALATSRALARLAARVERRTNGFVRDVDNIKEERAKRAAAGTRKQPRRKKREDKNKVPA